MLPGDDDQHHQVVVLLTSFFLFLLCIYVCGCIVKYSLVLVFNFSSSDSRFFLSHYFPIQFTFIQSIYSSTSFTSTPIFDIGILIRYISQFGLSIFFSLSSFHYLVLISTNCSSIIIISAYTKYPSQGSSSCLCFLFVYLWFFIFLFFIRFYSFYFGGFFCLDYFYCLFIIKCGKTCLVVVVYKKGEGLRKVKGNKEKKMKEAIKIMKQ